MDWAVPTHAEAQAMIDKAQAVLAQEKAKLDASASDLAEAQKRLAAANGDKVTVELNLQTVAMAQGRTLYQESLVRYQQAKRAFARCALANEQH
jgi:hypothetical protein